MADKSAYVPVEASGSGSNKPRPAELDIDVDDADYFGGGKPAATSASAPQQATSTPVTPASTPKQPIVYQKAKGYQKTYAYKK
ncbi:hypothetical protein QR680_016686 [Steinernema hermaphroditum]|uniref:Uncharacterized protein n=1 Tax=Steinernema hermaphroditum TaxID=289476 RepID=A0AA39LMU7_9BILA|nr:hypothetical protein QR680_016686 [Steinernema hermaphroditum]